MFLARNLSNKLLFKHSCTRPFAAASSLLKSDVPKRPKYVAEADIEETFLKGSGPGGQKINKTASAVQLKHVPTGIVIKVQDTRSRDLNRVLARRRLAEQIDVSQNGEGSWRLKKQELQGKRKAKRSQKSRAKYRKLEAEKSSTAAADASGEKQGGTGAGPID